MVFTCENAHSKKAQRSAVLKIQPGFVVGSQTYDSGPENVHL